MIKLIKIIYINILSLLDYNKIVIANKSNVKSGSEYKPIIIIIVSILYGLLAYNILNGLGQVIQDKQLILEIIFIFTTILSFIISLYNCNNSLYKNADNDILFSMPIQKEHIILSKLFNIYIKNILFILIFAFVGLLAYNNFVPVDKALALIIFIISFTIPLIPIIVASIITYSENYIELKYTSILKNIIKLLFISLIVIVIYFSFKTRSNSIETTIKTIIYNLSYIYPINYLFKITVKNLNLLTLFLILFISISLTIIFVKYLAKNYIKMCSILGGIKKNQKRVYQYNSSSTKLTGLINKELNYLFNDKMYLGTSFKNSLIFTIFLILFIIVFGTKTLTTNEEFMDYFNILAPSLLSLMICINSSTISAISIERENIDTLKTLPINFSKVLLSKFLIGVIFNLFFITINELLIIIFIKPNTFSAVMCFLIPLLSSVFTNSFYLILDYKFPALSEKSENVILNQRLICFIPPITALLHILFPFIFPIIRKSKVLLLTQVTFLIFLIIICLIYLLINNKKLYNKL